MNNAALRLFVRSIIAEAKEKKADKEPKKSVKKDTKKPEPKKAKKTSGNLVEMKQDLADLKDQLKEINELISALSNITPDSYNTDIEIIGDAIEKAQKQVEELKKEKESIEKEIAALKENTASEINKIKEMMGLAKPEKKGKKEIVGEDASYNNMIRKRYTPEQKEKFEKISKGAKDYSDALTKLEAAGCKHPEVWAEDFHRGPEELGEASAIKKEALLREGQFIRIKNDFTLDGKNFKKGDFVRAAKEFNAIEAAAKSGKIKKSDFEIVIGSAPLKEKVAKKASQLNEREHTYRKIDGVCYKIDDEGNRTKVSNTYCK